MPIIDDSCAGYIEPATPSKAFFATKAGRTITALATGIGGYAFFNGMVDGNLWQAAVAGAGFPIVALNSLNSSAHKLNNRLAEKVTTAFAQCAMATIYGGLGYYCATIVQTNQEAQNRIAAQPTINAMQPITTTAKELYCQGKTAVIEVNDTKRGISGKLDCTP